MGLQQPPDPRPGNPFLVDGHPGLPECSNDESDDVDAIRDDLGLGEILPYQRPVSAGEIHRDQSDLPPSQEMVQMGFEGLPGASREEVEDPVALQFVHRGRVEAPEEEVLIDPQHPRAIRQLALPDLDLQELMTPPLDRGMAQVLLVRESLLGDPFPMGPNDLAPKGFGRSLPGEESRETLAEIVVTGEAAELADFQEEVDPAEPPVFVPDRAEESVVGPVTRPATLGAFLGRPP